MNCNINIIQTRTMYNIETYIIRMCARYEQIGASEPRNNNVYTIENVRPLIFVHLTTIFGSIPFFFIIPNLTLKFFFYYVLFFSNILDSL